MSIHTKARILTVACWLLVALLLLLSNAALAQEASVAPAAPLISADDFEAMIKSLKAMARTMGPYLIDEGVSLAGAFFTFGLFVVGIRLIVGSGDPSVKADLIFHLFKAAIVLAMLASWMDYGAGSNQETVAPIGEWSTKISSYKLPYSTENIAVNSFDSLVNGMFDKWGGGGGKEKVFNTIGQSWNMMWKASAKRDEIRDKATSSSSTNPLNNILIWFEKLSDKAATLLAALVVALLALALMVVYLFVIYWGDVAAYAGMFIGPLMVPGLLYKRAEFLFDAWLKFMISAGFYKLIAAWMAILTMKTVEQIQVVANNMYAKYVVTGASGTLGQNLTNTVLESSAFILSIVMTIIYMAFGIMLMLRVGDLTSMLMRGFGGALAGVAQQTATSMMNKAKNATS